MSSITKFDITSPKNRKKVLDWLDRNGWMLYPFIPYWLLWKTGEFLVNAFKVDKEIEAQKKTAIAIIKAGYKNGVDEIEISLSEKAGLSFGADIEGFPVEFMAGSSGNMTLKVKYKDK